MTKKLKKIVFFGSGPVAAKSLDNLSNHFEIEEVITKSVPPHHKELAPVEILAKKLNISISFANTSNELDELFQKKSYISNLGVLIDYGVIVSNKVIDSFEFGILNSHFSLLPEWRGADPITFSILSGQEKTGVSLMLIDSGLDTGKIIVQKSLKIDISETTPSLTNKLIELSNQLLNKCIPDYLSGNIKPRRQSHPDRATYSRKLSKIDGHIDISKPAIQLEREVRAFIGWPKTYINIFNKDIIITKAHVSNIAESKIDIKCKDDNFLSIDELIAPSGRLMSSKDFINGYRII